MEKSVLLEKRKELEALVLNTQDEYVKFASYCNLYDLPSEVQEKIMKVYEEIIDNVEYVQKGNVRYIPLEKLSNDYRYVFDALVKMNGAMKIDVTKNISTFIKKYNSEDMYNMVNASGIEYTEEEKAYIANQVKFETDYVTLRAVINGKSNSKKDFGLLTDIITKTMSDKVFQSKITEPMLPTSDKKVKEIDKFVDLLDAFITKRLKNHTKSEEEKVETKYVASPELIVFLVHLFGNKVNHYVAEDGIVVKKDDVQYLFKNDNTVICYYEDGSKEILTWKELNDRLNQVVIVDDKKVEEKIEDTNAEVVTKATSEPVTDLVPVEQNFILVDDDTPEKSKKSGKGLKAVATLILLGCAVLAIALLARSCKKNNDNDKSNNGVDSEPTTSQTTELPTPGTETNEPTIIVTPFVDVNDEEALKEYAKDIQDKLKAYDIDLTIEEIVNAIKLVNVDSLDKQPFTSREEGYNAVQDAGIIGGALGSDSIVDKEKDPDRFITERTLDDMIKNVVPGFDKTTLELTKTGSGYDIYELADKLTAILNDNTKDNETLEQAAKLMNELMARKGRTFTVTNNSTVGQHYYLMGIYNLLNNKIYDLTAGRRFGPIYGDGEEIDGTYGFICVEELANYYRIGNINNMFYTEIMDKLIVADALLLANPNDKYTEAWVNNYIYETLSIYAEKTLELEQQETLTRSL